MTSACLRTKFSVLPMWEALLRADGSCHSRGHPLCSQCEGATTREHVHPCSRGVAPSRLRLAPSRRGEARYFVVY